MEFLDIVDETGRPTGETVSREIAHRDGVLHRTAHVWVIRPTEKGYDILLQKRSMEKESFPGLYDTSSAGHIPAGEEPMPSALRELREELGIAAKPGDLKPAGSFRIRYEKLFHGRLFKDNEVTQVYVYDRPVNIDALTLQAAELDEVRWFDLEEVWDEIQCSRERFCVPTPGLKLLRQYLKENDRGEKMAYTHVVQYYETDKMGITHHSNYIRWMEEARVDFLARAGWDYAKLEAMGIVSPVLSVSCDFRRPTTFSDRVTIHAAVEAFSGVKLRFAYEMKNQDGAVVCVGTSVHAFLNPEGKPIRMKREYPELFDAFTKLVSGSETNE